MRRTVFGRARVHLLEWAAFGLLLSLCGSSALAQAGSVAADPATTVVSNVDEVALDLTAYDKKGDIVADLKPGDLEIVDGGAPVRVKDLRIAQGFGAGHPYPVTLLFDRIEQSGAHGVREAALEIVKSAPAAGVLFTVLKVDGRLHLLRAPTADREALKRAIEAATAGNAESGAQAAEEEKRLVEDTKGGPNQTRANSLMAMLLDSQKEVRDPHTTPSIAGLLAASRWQQGAPGRKTLVYFSQGLNWNASAPEMLRSIVNEANRSRLSIYVLDANATEENTTDLQGAGGALASAAMARAGVRGASGFGQPLGVAPPQESGTTGPALQTLVAGQINRLEQTGSSAGDRTPLDALCRLTGGAHDHANDSRRAARRIVAEMESYYVASFDLPARASEGHFQPVSVRALRPGILIGARAGYFVPPRTAVPVSLAFEGRLLEVLAAPVLPSDFGLHSAALRFGSSADGSVNSLVVEAPLSDVDVRSDPAAKTYAAHLAVLAQVRNQAGALVARFTEDLPREGALEDREKAQRDVITLRHHFSAPPGDYVLETVALDVNGGKMAAQRTTLAILPSDGGPTLSDVVLVRRIEPFAGDEDTDRSDPLRCVEGRVIPNLSGQISKAASPALALFFDIYPERGSAGKPAIEARLVRHGAQGDKLIGTLPLTLPDDSGRPFIPYLAQLATASLAAGDYRLTVVLKQGARTASQSVSFALAP
jgi:VWFA-related protein